MFIDYFKSAFRNLTKHKGQTFISIAGLAAGFICCIMIFIWVEGELSYEKIHKNADHIYRAKTEHGRLWVAAVAPYLKETYPEITNSTRVHHRWWQLTYDNKSLNGRIHCVDPSFLDIFSYEFVKGNPANALASGESIIITETLANSIFGDKDPIGKIIQIEKREPLTVSGVIKDVPFNSHIQFDGLVNVNFLNVIFSWFPQMDSWTDGDMYTYIQVNPDIDVSALRAKVQKFADERSFERQIIFQPITDIHLYGDRGGAPLITYVYISIAAAILILLSACINYINLSTARASDRAKEVGIRKVVGASKANLILQFMGETVLVALSSAIIAMGIVKLLSPQFGELIGREILFNPFGNPVIILGILGIILATGIIAGIYPSLILSSFRPIKVLRSTFNDKSQKSIFRRVLLIGQFAVSIFLLVAVAVIYSQLDYIKNKDLGYDHSTILYVYLQSDFFRHVGPIMNDFDNNPDIADYTFTNTTLDSPETSTNNVKWEGQQEGEKIIFRVQAAGYGFADVFGIEMEEGRFFSRDFSTDLEQGYIVNEAAVTAMKMESPIGKRFSCQDREGRIIGVVKNYHFRSLHYEIQPLVLAMRPDWSDILAIRVESGNILRTADNIQGIIKKHIPDYPIEVRFSDQAIGRHYQTEKRIGKIFAIASGLAIFMSILGLIGLVSYAVRRRIKEIGVRKILGANVIGIVQLILKEFVYAVGLACIISWPLAYIACKRWLESYAFTINVSWAYFVIPGIITMLIAILTAGFYAFKAANTNPVETLKYE
ncbi:MAG: ABC transporter permease [candidate division Zixibacteria bacterium]